MLQWKLSNNNCYATLSPKKTMTIIITKKNSIQLFLYKQHILKYHFNVGHEIGYFWVPKTLTFKMRLGTQPFLWKMSFVCTRMKNDFHIKGWAPTLVFKLKPRGTRKWPIDNLKWEAMCSGLKIMADQRTMSTLNGILAGQKLPLPVL